MMARSHIIAGAAAWVGFSAITGAPMNPLLIIICAASSLLPDMDHPKSTFGSMIKPISIVISKIFGHRGITHSLLAIVLLAYLMARFGHLGHYIVSAIALGYLSHLAADFMTPAGVPLLYPIKYRFHSPITVVSGGKGEAFIIGIVVIITMLHLFMPETSYRSLFSTIKHAVTAIL